MRKLNVKAVRERLTQTGITQRQLAQACGAYESNLSAILAGKAYCGSWRARTILDALDQLERAEAKPIEVKDRDGSVRFRLTQV